MWGLCGLQVAGSTTTSGFMSALQVAEIHEAAMASYSY